MNRRKLIFSLSKFAVVAFVLGLVFSSCVPQKKILYLQNPEMQGDSSVNYVNNRVFDYTVQPGDNLYVRVVSSDEKTAKLFNLSGYSSYSSTTNSSGNAHIYLNGFTVSDQGYIDFPLAGKIDVKGMTLEQVQSRLQDVINVYLKETIVFVKLGVFNLTVLGEVVRPGQYQIYQSDINIFQAISLAGNLTDFAKKDHVKIIRQTQNGSQIIEVNLLEADVLSSPLYYLKPNDIIVVDPMPMKQFGFTSFPYSTVISITTLALTLINFFTK